MALENIPLKGGWEGVVGFVVEAVLKTWIWWVVPLVDGSLGDMVEGFWTGFWMMTHQLKLASKGNSNSNFKERRVVLTD